jgi:23S rRNA A2030 N6-methylase RlmJ
VATLEWSHSETARNHLTGSYDHQTKAGNQGDVVKHVALIAALRAEWVIPQAHHRSYADLFAGYANSPLASGGSWERGIGVVRARLDAGAKVTNPDVEHWCQTYLATRPRLEMGVYPGSSVIAYDTAASLGAAVRLSLWDTSPRCVESLSDVFGRGAHRVHNCEAQLGDEDVRTADFLFIDPPDKKRWPMIQSVLRAGNATGQPVLVWLPVAAGDGEAPEDEASIQCRNEARAAGCEVLRVCWDASASSTIGCLLAYRLSLVGRNAVRSAVREVVSLAGWVERVSIPAFEIFDR